MTTRREVSGDTPKEQVLHDLYGPAQTLAM